VRENNSIGVEEGEKSRWNFIISGSIYGMIVMRLDTTDITTVGILKSP
jgi:hypothetical protein